MDVTTHKFILDNLEFILLFPPVHKVLIILIYTGSELIVYSDISRY